MQNGRKYQQKTTDLLTLRKKRKGFRKKEAALAKSKDSPSIQESGQA